MVKRTLLGVAVGLFITAPAQAAGFDLGVSAGDVTSTSALIWTRAPQAGIVKVVVFDDSNPLPNLVLFPLPRQRAQKAHDFTVTFTLRKLKPGHRYLYQFLQGATLSVQGSFRTSPLRTASARVRFAVSGDADATKNPRTGKPAYNAFGVYARMRAERNDFNVNLGDTIYSDSAVPGSPPALSLRAKWRKYRLNIAQPALRALRASATLYEQWDDHEFANDFSVPENGRALYTTGVRAFRDYNPVTYTPRLGLYRSFRWGKNVEVFMLDLRSFRSAKASAHGVCDNGGSPDLAPTMPQAVRNLLASRGLPSLARPVSAACLAAIDDPGRTMLGARQLVAFEQAVAKSGARFKVILNETPIMQFYADPYDRWEGYAAERTTLLTYLRDHVKNAVFLSTDTHANLVNDARLSTLEPQGRVDSGITEVVTGPVAAPTFTKEIDGILHRPGETHAIVRDFLEPDRLGGVLPGIGMRCAATNAYAYAEVTATRDTLNVVLKDIKGRRVRDEVTGKPCATVVVHARS